jgi:hypothetical protein
MSWLMREDQRMVEDLLLQQVVTLTEARRLRTPSSPDPFLRDAVDNLLMVLSGYPLGEGGPRSGLDQLEYFGKAIAREPIEFANGLDTRVGRIIIEATTGLTRENRAARRWAILEPLGAPAMDRKEAGLNVWVRALASRAADGLLHPALCAGQMRVGSLSREDGYISAELKTRLSVPNLYSEWCSDPQSRKDLEKTMLDRFASVSWSQSLG